MRGIPFHVQYSRHLNLLDLLTECSIQANDEPGIVYTKDQALSLASLWGFCTPEASLWFSVDSSSSYIPHTKTSAAPVRGQNSSESAGHLVSICESEVASIVDMVDTRQSGRGPKNGEKDAKMILLFCEKK